MTMTPNLAALTIEGPGWSADVDVVELQEPRRNLALRTLFLDSLPRKIAGSAQVFAPGTLLALVSPREVRIQPIATQNPIYRWTRVGAAPALSGPAAIRAALGAGQAALLLLAANPALWPDKATGKLPTLTCLAGDIGLDALKPAQNTTIQKLYSALALDLPPAAPLPQNRDGAARLVGAISVHGSGISLYGRAALPWEPAAARIAAVFQLTRELADPPAAAPAWRLSIELERLTSDESAALLAAWGRLSRALNPRNPLHGPAFAETPTPRWATLEIVDPLAIPHMFWRLSSWQEQTAALPLRFDRGALNLLLSDQRPYDRAAPPTSLARYLPAIVVIERAAATLTITLGAPISHQSDILTYAAARDAAVPERWNEQVTLTALDLALDPLETPRMLRTSLGLPAPIWAGPGQGLLDPQLLWGFTPLEDGWAQLPIPNLTEQIYLDALPDTPDDPPGPTVLQGAVALGNSRDEVLRDRRDEQAWNVTLLDADAIFGQWTLQQQADATFALHTIALTLDRPDVVVGGLLWLSTSRPSIADALPDLVNWVAGLRPVQLKSMRLTQKRFPPLVTFGLQQLSFAAADLQIERAIPTDATKVALSLPKIELAVADLHAWTLVYRVDAALLQTLAAANVGLLAPGVFGANPALVWRRHPTLPMIQTLPLTQSQSPPSYPAASRQLAPFALPIVQQSNAGVTLDLPGAWSFGVTANRAAATWPSLRSAAVAAAEWRRLSDLPLAALSIPGLLLDPSALAAATGLPGALLPVQYRFDLPYTDEINALAQLPKIPRDPTQVSPLPDEPPPTPPKPLTRETFAEHWQRLSERASLASADDVTAFDRVAAQAIVRHLIEPYTWDVQTDFSAAAYPGSLAIGMPAPLTEETALAGISGRFTQAGGKLTRLPDAAPAAGALEVTSGSMAAALAAPGVLRDQRGLKRHASGLVGPLLTTEVALTTANPADEISYQLTSTFEPCELQAGDGQIWRFWCRDLPIRSSSGLFDRSRAHSDRRLDVNDPEALASDYDYLGGYEWRIAGNQPEIEHPALLRLYGLLFYPLTLDEVQVRNGQIERVALTGRLQLALPDLAELTDLANPVQVTFSRSATGLALSAIRVANRLAPDDATANQIAWPLALVDDELASAPQLRWTSVALQGRNIVVQDPKLHFFLFDVAWTLNVTALVFTPAGGLATAPAIQTSIGSGALSVASAGLTLDLATGQHAAHVDLLLRLGRQFLAAASGPARGAFTATVRFELAVALPTVQASWQSAVLFDDLPIALAAATGAELRYAGRALQFAWQQLTPAVDTRFQLLPGMHLLPPALPGFAALTFSVTPVADSAPTLTLASAFVEALLYSRWGAFLQDDGALSAERVFGSSAGDLACGYTAQWQNGAWDEAFLLNGFLEVKSLISWPLDLRYVENERMLTLPAARGPGATSPLRHTRHTLRVLLNQQALDPALLAPGPGNLLFQLAAGHSWQFLAVAEHQLFDLLPPTAPGAVVAPGPQQRWTALQEVRILSRSSMISFLETYGAAAARAFDPTSGLNTLSAAVDGALRAGLRERLSAAIGLLPDDTLLVEASAPHWISKRRLNDARPTTLQFLPGGSQHGILSGPQDYAPSDPHDPAWLLLTTPFLGRLQDAARDSAAASTRLQADPIVQLQNAAAGTQLDALLLALTNRGDDADARLRIADMDTSVGRSWARLDPLTLEENWFRIGTPRPEPPADRLQSIAAALPDTPARLSRSVALRRAFDVFRPSYPPQDDGRYELPDEISGAAIVWRPDSILVQQSLADGRTTRGLVALYTFGEGSGTTVNDVSGVGSPLNLKISPAAAVTWLPTGGLRVTAPALIASPADTKKIFDACVATQELTIEMWIKPASVTVPSPSRPGRIVVLSKDFDHRNFVVQQGTFDEPIASHYHVRLHTDKTGDDKQPALVSPDNSLKPALQHVVYTRDAAGQTRLYIDGVQQATDSRPGKLEWNNKYVLALANEPSNDRPWLGEYYLVAIYSQALSAGEVLSNFAARARPAVYGWHSTGLLRASVLAASAGDAPTAVQRHAAATLLPAQLAPTIRRHTGGQPVSETHANPMPLSFAVSPYVGLAFRRAPAASELKLLLLAAELLCLDSTSGAMRPVASYIWEIAAKADEAETAAEIAAVRSLCQTWAADTQRQLAPESPVAVLRLREVYDQIDSANSLSSAQALLTTGYRFELVADQTAPIELVRRVARLRAAAPLLRFRAGQYGGHQLPENVRPFELAPPQTIGVQPLYLIARPDTLATALTAWPWGLSALRLSVRFTTADAGVIGAAVAPSQPRTLWWQAPQYRAQFRSVLHSTLPTAGLPKLFRATAVRALLPVAPNPQMPAQPLAPLGSIDDQNEGAEDPNDQLTWWQPVLPGALRYIVSGARPGVTFAFRNQLLRQRLDESAAEPALISGSVPVQHRAPRPVPLPENAPADQARQDVALRSWASYFAPASSLRVATSPLDEAFFAGAVLPAGAAGSTTARPPRGLLLRLVSPTSGKLDSSWDREFVFEATTLAANDALTNWTIELTAQAAGRSLSYLLQPLDGNQLRFVPKELPPRPNEKQPEDPRDALLGRSAPGDTITLIARVAPNDAGFQQMLVFTLRVGDDIGLPLPLEPAFIHFEDPEYNRRLASQSAIASQLIALADADKRPLLKTLVLATDRREYNPSSVLALRYDWDDDSALAGQLELRRIDFNGIETELTLPTSDHDTPGLLRQFSLLDLKRAPDIDSEKPPLLRPGDTLQLKLKLQANGAEVLDDQAVVLEVRIVADPVIPVPEAGYALLRSQTQNGQPQVECARFAWGPNASRIELVDANDLRTEVVRRRAVFQWQDACRPGSVQGYAIQKLTMGGSTHGGAEWVAITGEEA